MILDLILVSISLLQSTYSAYLLKTGEHLRAAVLTIQGDEATLEVPLLGGHAVVRKGMDQFTAASRYRMRASLGRADTAEEHIDLARYAVSQGLIAVAERELRLAREVAKNPQLADDLASDISQKGAQSLETLARERLVEGDVVDARRLVAQIFVRYPDSEAALRKDGLLAMLDEADKCMAELREYDNTRRAAIALEKEREKLLAAVQKHLDDGRAANRNGLLASKHFAQVKEQFLRAVRHYEDAMQLAERTLKAHANDQVLVGGLADLTQRANEEAVEPILNVANLSVVKGSYNQAIGYVNRVLAMDSRNRAALDMRARIEIAASRATRY